jgi:hypothetical protein
MLRVNGVRAGRDALNSTLLQQQLFQLRDQFGFEHMLDRIRTLVDSSRCDVRMSDQIQFPEPMFVNQP